jgi:hypothetical protein
MRSFLLNNDDLPNENVQTLYEKYMKNKSINWQNDIEHLKVENKPNKNYYV